MIAINIGALALPVSPVLLLLSVVVGLAVASLVAKNQQSRVTDQLLVVLLVSLVFGRIVFIWRFADSYESFWQMLDIRDRGIDLPAAIFSAVLVLMAQIRRYPLLRTALLSGGMTSLALFTLSMSVVSFGQKNAQLPEVDLPQLNGGYFNLKQSFGSYTVINLWASWCPPCVREMPVFYKASQQHPEVNFILVNQQESVTAVRRFLALRSLKFEYVLMDKTAELPGHFGAHGLPATLFFDKEGKLVSSHMGALSDASLSAALDHLTNK